MTGTAGTSTAGNANVLLIGASRGLGLATAAAYLDRGAHVVATVRGDAVTPLHELRDRADGRLEIERVDIDEPAQVRGLHDRLRGRTFDLLFVIAGVTHRIEDTTATITTEEFTRVMVTNALSPLRVLETLGHLTRPDGTLAVMSSGQGSVANNRGGGWEIYRASKAALNQLMRSYAARHRDEERTFLLLAPGWVRTELGGPNARLDIDESIPSLVSTIDAHHGDPGLHYLDYRGRTVPW